MCYTIRAMIRTDVQVNFRMPAELKAALEVESKKNHRSLTAEVVARLEESFDPSRSMPLPPEAKHVIEREAGKSKRSVAAEIEARLSATFEQDLLLGSWSEGEHGHRDAIEWISQLRREVQDIEEERNELENNPIVLDGGELAQGLARRLKEHFPALLQMLDYQGPAHRLRRSGSTYGNLEDLLQCLELLRPITSVVLAVRPGEANYSALTMAIETETATVIADRLYLTIERSPRESEVQELFRQLDKLGLLEGSARFATERIGETDELDANGVWRYLNSRKLQPLTHQTLPTFLQLFMEQPVEFDAERLGKYFA